MQRRTYLATIGVVTGTAVAGCSGDTGGNNSSGSGGNASGSGNATATSSGTPASGGSTTAGSEETTTGNESTAASTATEATNGTQMPTTMREPSPTATATSTAAPVGTSTNSETAMPTAGSTTMGGMSGGGDNADVSIDSSEFSKQTDAGITDTAMVGKLTAPSYLSSIELQARFRNEGGDILDTESAYFQGLEKDQTWNFYVPSLASQTPADGEIEVASATMGSAPSDSGAKIVESNLNDPADEFSGPTVTGRAENTSGSTLSYLEARIHFLTDDGTALESDYTNVSDLPAGETWSFELEAITFSTDPRPDITDFDVTLASGL